MTNINNLSLPELINLGKEVRTTLKYKHKWYIQDRPSWDEYYSYMAYVVSLRGSCVRRQVGAIFVSQDHDTLSTGYNGKGATLINCEDHPCNGACASSGTNLEGCEAIHAEVNALIRCTERDKIHTLYVTCSPCTSCIDILLGTKCKRIVFSEEYKHNEESKRRWLAAGREWIYFQGSLVSD